MPVPSTTAPAAQPTAAGERPNDYFPVLENYRLTYEGAGNEYASYVAYTEFQEGNKLQRRIDNGGTVTSRVYKWENGKLTRVNSVPEAYVRENLLNTPETESEVLLQEPLTVGTAWDAANARRSITGVNVPVQTSSGNYTALEVTTQGSDYKTVDYYAKGIGLVKSIFQSGDTEVVSSLAEMKNNAPFLQVIRLYYPGADGVGRYYREVQLALTTNMTLDTALVEAYQVEPKGKAGRVFTPGTRILSIRKSAGNVILLDLNQAFITERTGSSAYVEGVLHSVADTFGELYMAEKVLLTVEGKPYKSNQFTMKEGEPLTVERTEAQIIID
jgi:spore germination protein GerM